MPKHAPPRRTLLYIMGLVITCVAIAPKSFFDPINIPKLIILAVFSALVIADLAINRKQYSAELLVRNSLALAGSILFFIAIFLSTGINHTSLQERIFGISGRNNGVLFYLSLLVIFTCIAMLKELRIDYFLYGLGVSNILCVGYYFIQKVGLDWNTFSNTWSSPSSFLGNPNFVSSFSAISALSFIFLIKKHKEFYIRLSSIFLILSTLYLIWDSESIQGFFAFFAGLAVITLFDAHYFNSKRKIVAGLATLFFGGICLFLSLLGIGPLGNIFSVDSLITRLMYWKTAIIILIKYPLFGVGLDNFGNYYRAYKLEALGDNSKYLSLYTDSAHNIFLDIGVGLGIIGLTGYILIIISVYNSMIRTKIYTLNVLGGGIHSNFVALNILFGVWTGYLAQALISINQIGIAVWGWTIPAIILNVSSRIESSSSNLGSRKRFFNRERLVFRFNDKILGAILALFLCVSAFGLFRVESEFFKAAGERNGNKLIANVNKWPQSSFRFNSLAKGLLESGNKELALNVAWSGVLCFPMNVDLWEFIYENEIYESARFNESVSRIKVLDPVYSFNRTEVSR